jgi:hypothetical protein
LERDWGFTVRGGEVSLRRYYDAVEARVVSDDRVALHLTVADPEPLGPHDIQYVANLNLARTPRGIRLVQVEPRSQIARAERGRGVLHSFGNPMGRTRPAAGLSHLRRAGLRRRRIPGHSLPVSRRPLGVRRNGAGWVTLNRKRWLPMNLLEAGSGRVR